MYLKSLSWGILIIAFFLVFQQQFSALKCHKHKKGYTICILIDKYALHLKMQSYTHPGLTGRDAGRS